MRLTPVLITTADAAALLVLRPDPSGLRAGLAAPRAWIERDGVDAVLVDLVGTALWLAAVWLAVGLLATAAAGSPGALGRCAQRISCVVLPRTVQRVLAGSAGLSILLAPAVAQARSHWVPAPGPSAHSVTATAEPAPGPAWPTTRSSAGPSTTPSLAPLPGPSWPGRIVTPTRTPTSPSTSASGPDVERPSDTPGRHSTPSAPGHTPTSTPRTTPGHPPPAQRRPAPATIQPTRPDAPTPDQDPAQTADRVRVNHGDALWLIAAHRLGPDPSETATVHYWPRIYAANRDVIGDDPSFIQPGQVLQLPAPSPQESS